jgi:hypothetical protein
MGRKNSLCHDSVCEIERERHRDRCMHSHLIRHSAQCNMNITQQCDREFCARMMTQNTFRMTRFAVCVRRIWVSKIPHSLSLLNRILRSSWHWHIVNRRVSENLSAVCGGGERKLNNRMCICACIERWNKYECAVLSNSFDKFLRNF